VSGFVAALLHQTVPEVSRFADVVSERGRVVGYPQTIVLHQPEDEDLWADIDEASTGEEVREEAGAEGRQERA
jgi:hypothetical protein